MLNQPEKKYGTRVPFTLLSPKWPLVEHPKIPVWCSVDLRDGNQSLPNVMGPAEKFAYFQMLVSVGFREIEVGFPAASEVERIFIRSLIEGKHVPDGVTLQALCRAASTDMQVTFETLRGAKRAIVHFYLATAPIMREQVLRMSQSVQLVHVESFASMFLQLAAEYPETEWVPQFSLEMFTQTEMEYAVRVCNAVTEVFAQEGKMLILNLPATVEQCWPDEYANMVESVVSQLQHREQVILSVHPHNDRGTAVAAAVLALKAGADRVEGCLFGNGERAGNLDVFTLAMDFYADGRNPGLDFGQLDDIVHIYEDSTGMTVHDRHPYAGSLVFTAFSGTHQDAINKTTLNQKADGSWQVAYNNIDPADLGRHFDAVGVNSQSGSGGVGYVLRQCYQLRLPTQMQKEFGKIVQASVELSGGGLLSPEDIWVLFLSTYVTPEQGTYRYVDASMNGLGKRRHVYATLQKAQQALVIEGAGNGPIEAFVVALRSIGHVLDVGIYQEYSLGDDAGARACAVVEATLDGKTAYGCGISTDTLEASLQAVLSALNRCLVAR